MIQKLAEKYEEWLTTITNTRLIFNTMNELEEMLDNHSIHNNGIKRSFSSPQKMRAAFRDLMVEVNFITDGFINLNTTLFHYKNAWEFFKNYLTRRVHPEQVVLEILSFCYPPFIQEGLGPKKRTIYEQIIEQSINVPFLVLMLLKAIPGYDSKEGDVDYNDIFSKYDDVINLLEQFTSQGTIFTLLPQITRAREETNKTRLMLLFHVSQILETYSAYADRRCLYDTAHLVKKSSIDLEIDGFWNECGGVLLHTNFWQIEKALGCGSYFLTHWHKDAKNRLTGITYTLFLSEGVNGNIIYYILHPEAIQHKMKGIPYQESDHVWYQTKLTTKKPNEIFLQRIIFSEIWPQEIRLTRCVDKNVVSQYDKWLNNECEIIKSFKELEYVFHPNIYALTHTHIYIPSENEGEYYKVPITAHEGLDRIQLSDNVGTMIMNKKTYLVFDELFLYIDTSKKELQKFDIERVDCID